MAIYAKTKQRTLLMLFSSLQTELLTIQIFAYDGSKELNHELPMKACSCHVIVHIDFRCWCLWRLESEFCFVLWTFATSQGGYGSLFLSLFDSHDFVLVDSFSQRMNKAHPLAQFSSESKWVFPLASMNRISVVWIFLGPNMEEREWNVIPLAVLHCQLVLVLSTKEMTQMNPYSEMRHHHLWMG